MTEVKSRDSVDWPRGAKDILAGLILPLPLFIFGGVCVVTRTGWIPGYGRIPGSGNLLAVHGSAAVALGISAIAVALFICTRFILRNWFGCWRTAAVIEAVMLLTFAVSLCAVIVSYVASGRA